MLTKAVVVWACGAYINTAWYARAYQAVHLLTLKWNLEWSIQLHLLLHLHWNTFFFSWTQCYWPLCVSQLKNDMSKWILTESVLLSWLDHRPTLESHSLLLLGEHDWFFLYPVIKEDQTNILFFHWLAYHSASLVCAWVSHVKSCQVYLYAVARLQHGWPTVLRQYCEACSYCLLYDWHGQQS